MDSQLRFFSVPRKSALTPQADTLETTWEVCTPDTARKFSAVAYFFAHGLRKALGIPVGVIVSAWPGTAAEEWTDPESLRRDPVLRHIVQRWDASPAAVRAFAAEPSEISLEFDDFELLPSPGDSRAPLQLSNFDDGASRTQTGGAWSYTWQDAASTAFELVAPGRGGAGYAARVAGKLDGANYASLRASFKDDDSPDNHRLG